MNADDLAKILDELGRRLGPTGSHVFDLAVRQQIIDGLFWLAGLIGLAVLAIVATFGMHAEMAANNRKYTSDNDSYFPLGWRVFFYAIAWSVFLVVLLLVGGSVASKLLNPEYAALRDILGAIR